MGREGEDRRAFHESWKVRSESEKVDVAVDPSSGCVATEAIPQRPVAGDGKPKPGRSGPKPRHRIDDFFQTFSPDETARREDHGAPIKWYGGRAVDGLEVDAASDQAVLFRPSDALSEEAVDEHLGIA